MNYDYGRKTMRTWLHDQDVPAGCTEINVKYLRTLKQLSKELGRAACIGHFLITKLNIQSVNAMMKSAKKQRYLLICICGKLKNSKVTSEWIKTFDHDINMIKDRIKYLDFIISENLRMTEYYPYFKEVGFEKLVSFSNDGWHEENPLEYLIPEIEAWNAEHPDEIARHMEETREEREATEALRAKNKAAAKAEKAQRRAEKKAENDYIAVRGCQKMADLFLYTHGMFIMLLQDMAALEQKTAIRTHGLRLTHGLVTRKSDTKL